MRLSELFVSVQGEQPFVGKVCVFVRFSGCNLRCPWCDTKYASKVREEVSPEGLVMRVEQYGFKDVVLTGGEPLVQPHSELSALILTLRQLGYQVQIETNGLLWEPWKGVWWNISPKLWCIERYSAYLWRSWAEDEYVHLKFVVADVKEVEQVHEICQWYEIPKRKVFLMPRAADRVTYLKLAQAVWAWCVQYHFGFGVREQIAVHDTRARI